MAVPETARYPAPEAVQAEAEVEAQVVQALMVQEEEPAAAAAFLVIQASLAAAAEEEEAVTTAQEVAAAAAADIATIQAAIAVQAEMAALVAQVPCLLFGRRLLCTFDW